MVNEKGQITHSKVRLEPYLINSGFTEPKEPLDAAVTSELGEESDDRYQIFFKGDKYTLYKRFMRKHSGPHSIHDASGPLKVAFPRDVSKINAAMNLQSKNGKLYFFFRQNNVGKYYRYDTRKQAFDDTYPKEATNGWIGMPDGGPDAAISSTKTGKTYFIADNKIYKIYNKFANVVYGYPRSVGSEFMRCGRPSDMEGGQIKIDAVSMLTKLFVYSSQDEDQDENRSNIQVGEEGEMKF
jgi:hypothetical protein